jgi:hypothetical protein
MTDIKNIILNSTDDALEKSIAPFIEEQFPTFIRSDYRKLVLFIKSYYEWMNAQGNPGYVTANLESIYDADKNLEEFYSHFKNVYMEGFPEIFATNTSGNKPNKKTLLKKIRDFYGNKGTESSYKFLFRLLYDSDLEVYYPKDDLLKVSDGRWVEPVSIKISSLNGTALFDLKGGQVQQINGNGESISSADIDTVIQYTQNGIRVTELFLQNLVGDFFPGVEVRATTATGTEYRETAFSVLGDFFIEVPGEGYQIGDTVSVTAIPAQALVDNIQTTPTEDGETGEGSQQSSALIENTQSVVLGGIGFSARVEQVGFSGNIKRISIINSGLNYGADIVVNIFSPTGKKKAVVYALRKAITRYPGYFKGNSGKVSSNKKIQDGHYYQEFSYELKGRVGIDEYFDVLRQLVHPAGMRMFGSVLLKGDLNNTISTSTQFTRFESPVIGRYTPYALRTFNDLRGGYFLPNQVKGATLQVWLSGYNIAGNTTDGMTADWAYYIREKTYDLETGEFISPENWGDVFFGIRHWRSLVGGHTFSHWADLPNTSYWLTPNAKREAVNTHFSVDFMPVNYRFAARTPTGAPWTTARNLGFSGPTVGALGLSAARSYFAVVKPGRVSATSMGVVSATDNPGAFVLCDNGASSWSSSHGIVIGFTGGGNQPKLVAFNRTASASVTVQGNFGATGEWRLISHTYSVGSGSSGPMSLFLDGVSLATQESVGVPATSIATGNLMVGVRRFSNVGAFDGEIAEILAYQGALSDGDRQKVEGYLAHKYNIDGNLPQGHPYKTTPPGASLPAGGWSGATGDFYPRGYNPYIGSTTETGPDGSTAAAGSLFFRSGLGYTYTVVDEFGLTAHNPIGAPLGSTTAWLRGRETILEPKDLPGLVLWLKPENIGVCGSVANGASMDVWRDASPEQNHAVPPTWDKWNGVATLTHNATSSTSWTRTVYDSVHPLTKIQFKFNGVCGGYTSGRLCVVGLSTTPSNGTFDPIHGVYSYGARAADPTANRTIYYRNYTSLTQSVAATPTGITQSTDFTAFDDSVFEVEYVDPYVIYRRDGVEEGKIYEGHNASLYFKSSFFYSNSDNTSGHSVTVLETSYKGRAVTPTFQTTGSPAVNVVNYAGMTVDKLRPTLVINDNSTSGATGIEFNTGTLYSPDKTTWRQTTTNYYPYSDLLSDPNNNAPLGITLSRTTGPFHPTLPVAVRMSVGNHQLSPPYTAGVTNVALFNKLVSDINPSVNGVVYSCYYRPVSTGSNQFIIRDGTNSTNNVVCNIANSPSGATLSSFSVSYAGPANATNSGAYVIRLKDNWNKIVVYGSSAAFLPSCTSVYVYHGFGGGGWTAGITADIWGVQVESQGRTFAGHHVPTIGVSKYGSNPLLSYLEGDQLLPFVTGGTGESILRARHMWLTKPLVFTDEMDYFMVYRKTSDSSGTGFFVNNASKFRYQGYEPYGTVMFLRSYNPTDLDPAKQLEGAGYYNFVYGSVPGSTTGEVGVVSVLYPYNAGNFVFSPWVSGTSLGVNVSEASRRQLSYDPHVSGVAAGRSIVEASRSSSKSIQAFWNGDLAVNKSRSTGRYTSKSYAGTNEADDVDLGLDFQGSDTQNVVYDGPVRINSFNSVARVTTNTNPPGPFASSEFVNNIITATGYNGGVILNEVIAFNRKLSDYERQVVYGYLSRKYRDLENNLPDQYYRTHTSTYEQGMTYWIIESHPNKKNLDTIPFGSEFSGLKVRDFLGVPDFVYKSAGTVLADGTVLTTDTYDNIGL